MENPLSKMSQKEFERHFKEYEVCRAEVARLESNIW